MRPAGAHFSGFVQVDDNVARRPQRILHILSLIHISFVYPYSSCLSQQLLPPGAQGSQHMAHAHVIACLLYTSHLIGEAPDVAQADG